MSNLDKAAEFKAKGNDAFKAQQWEQAIQYFTQAIECNPNDHVFWSNRSGSYCNTSQYEKALEDAQKCITINPSFARGHQRKGTALFYLGQVD
jgi:tetratricopeptide (TPR) repeat protein